MNYEDKICTVCEKGRLIRHKEDIRFGTITVMQQLLYVCDTCDAAFQTTDDYRHTEYLRSMTHLRSNNRKGRKINMDSSL